MVELTREFWDNRYKNQETGWDIGYISTPLKEYFDQIQDKAIKILIPGCGNAYEAEYLFNNGFKNIYMVDFSSLALNNLFKRVPELDKTHLICDDFFNLNDTFDLIIEQTFFCAINPELREKYVEQMYSLLNKNGKLVGLLFNDELNNDKPPFGGNAAEYKKLFLPYFDIKIIEKCYNSIEPRKDRELFIEMVKRTLN
ncbi:MAG: methyltransferase domain-containing protein [Flavobacteriales bacterium]